jgi:hypothetical protein
VEKNPNPKIKQDPHETISHHTRSHDEKLPPPKPNDERKQEMNPHLSYDDRVRINSLYHIAKWPINKICEEMHVTRPTVELWISRDTYDEVSRSGRPREYSLEILARLQREHQEWSMLDIQRHWPVQPGEKAPSVSTLYEMYEKLPFQTYINKPHHQFTQQQLVDRVEAAKLHKGPRKCHNVWFPDETNSGKQAHAHRLHAFPGDDPNYQVLRKIKGFSGHFFGAICYYGRSELIAYPRKLDSKDYQLLLDNHIILKANKVYGWKSGGKERNWSLCAGNDGSHVSRDTKEYLEAHGVKIWWLPAWSPDINPMEFIWSLLWAAVTKMKPSTSEEVIEYTRKCWHEIPQSTIQNAIDHLNAVYNYVIENNGALYKHQK